MVLRGASLITFLIVFSGCDFSKYFNPNWLNPVTFNNRFVDFVDEVVVQMEDSYKLYDEKIPSVVKADTTFEVKDFDRFVAEISDLGERGEKMRKLKSRDENQEKIVQKEFELYLKILENYGRIYKDMSIFYAAKEYKERGELVSKYNKDIDQAYQRFSETHTNFVEKVLPSFQKQ